MPWEPNQRTIIPRGVGFWHPGKSSKPLCAHGKQSNQGFATILCTRSESDLRSTTTESSTTALTRQLGTTGCCIVGLRNRTAMKNIWHSQSSRPTSQKETSCNCLCNKYCSEHNYINPNILFIWFIVLLVPEFGSTVGEKLNFPLMMFDCMK